MDYQEMVKDLAYVTDTKIVMLIMDGLGGLQMENGGKTELETAKTPNMDKLAASSSCGLLDPIYPGITPGSGPGHLALFGYDPVKWNMGRGVLEALGINFPLQCGDVAIRINFSTVDDDGVVTDRRAGRISTEKCEELAAELDKIEVSGAEVMVRPVKEHRAVVVFRADGLGDAINDTDPQVTGKMPLPMEPGDKESEKTVKITGEWLDQAKNILKDHHPANMVLLRGFASYKDYPSFKDMYKLTSAAIAQYPMYKGLAGLVGMDVKEDVGDKLEDLVKCLKSNWNDYDFLFVHVKKTDSYGEDGNFDAKVKIIEEVDTLIPSILDLSPHVLIITGDHSTPAKIGSHSWHPLPFLLNSEYCRQDRAEEFTERACARGSMGRLQTTSLMPIAMANALKLKKFGA